MAKNQVVEKFILKSEGFLRKNSPTILTCVGAVGVVATAVVTAKATPKALSLLETAEEKKGEELTKKEKFKVAAPVFIPAAIVGGATISCIFGSNILNKKQQAALVSAYAALNKTYNDHKDKIEELYGENAIKTVAEEISKDKRKDANVETAEGEVVFYDEYSKRFFASTHERVQKAQYYLNRNLTMRDYAYLNEWYHELGLPEVEHGYTLGWTTALCTDHYWQPWIDFTKEHVVDDDGKDYYIIRMFQEPIAGFEDY